MMRALLVLAALLAGCACSAIGCANRIDFVTPFDVERDTAYRVEACIDGRCATAAMVVDGPITQTGDVDGALTLWEDSDRVEFALGDGDFGGGHAVTFIMRDESGVIVAAFDGTIELTRSHPNGPWCEPTCWYAEVDA